MAVNADVVVADMSTDVALHVHARVYAVEKQKSKNSAH